jgi:hypothetical protein
MKFFPHNLGGNQLPSAVTASITSQSLFLNNFSGTVVNTVSLALNISGSRGASGTSVLVAGIPGPVGDAGPQGDPGTGIYVLPPERTTYLATTQITLQGGSYVCGTPSQAFSSNCWAIRTLPGVGTGCTLYSGTGCNPSPASDGLYAVNVGSKFPVVYSVNDQGCMTYVADCFPPL